jgi:hypothetical protein
MKINVSVQVEENEQAIDQEATALAILKALNGDPSKDEITLYVQAAPPDPVRIGPEITAPPPPEQ